MLNLQEMKTNLLKKVAIMLIDNKIFQIVGVLLIAAFTLGFGIGAVTEYSLTTKNKVVTEVYVVKQGDTLMEICAEYRKRDCRNPYILEYLDEIRRLNPHIDSNLQIGDELKIQYKVSGNN